MRISVLKIHENIEKHRSTLLRSVSLSLFGAIVFIRLTTLGLYPLLDSSESRYAEMGRKMLEIGNWTTPMIDYGVPFWGKPPLTIWLTAFSLHYLGINEFAARFGSFITSAATAFLLYLLANHQNKEKALDAVIILASSLLFFVLSGVVAMDTSLCLGITMALAAFWIAINTGSRFWGYFIFIGLSIGLLAKGPITLVLSGLTIGIWTLLTKSWQKVWQKIPWLTGSVLMVCLTVPWYLAAERATPGFLHYFIIGEHWQRFTQSGWKGDLYGAGREHVHGMIWAYWFLACFPWGLLFVYKLYKAANENDGFSNLIKPKNNWRLYCLLWMLSPLVFFTFSSNILWTYVLPALPGFSLLLAEWLGQSRCKTVCALVVPLAFVVLVIFYQVTGKELYHTQKSLTNTFMQQAQQNGQLYYVENIPSSAQFYTSGHALRIDPSTLTAEHSNDHNFYVISMDKFSRLPENIKSHFSKIKSSGHFLLLHGNSPVEK